VQPLPPLESLAEQPPVPTLTVGRDPGNQVVVADPLVSRFHARIDLSRPPVIHDLDSFRGTFVNGERVQGPVLLTPGAEVLVSTRSLRWDGQALAPAPAVRDQAFYAESLAFDVKGRRLLDDVSFKLAPASLTAVIGPSGAGKSTLLGAMTGLQPATAGRVTWQDLDLYSHYEQLRFQIGLVPQQDIQHHQLKVAQALGFSAELRLPPDTSPQERAHQVSLVAGQLQLLERMDNRIGTQLSGGQRKRVSIATELLTAPPLLVLDEPTSGLDPGLDVEVMRQLRALADEGRIIVVVTHSVLALDTCDNVLVLAPGGRVAYFGDPTDVLSHFGCSSYPEVFDKLDQSRSLVRTSPPVPLAAPPAAAPIGPRVKPKPSRTTMKSHLRTLIRRNAAVVAADRLLLAMVIAMPLILGILSRVVPGQGGFSLLEAPLSPAGTVSAEEAGKRVTLLIVAAALMGTAMAIRELVSERPIFRREYAVGLSPDVYLASKIAVLGAVTFIQGVVVTIFATVGLPGPDFGGAIGLGRFELALAIGALCFTMAVVGLTLSAVLTSTEQTMPALVGVVMLQLVLSGALVGVSGRPFLEQLSWLSPARWAYAACASTVAIQRPLRAQGAELDWIAIHTPAHWMMNMGMLAILCCGCSALAVMAARRSAKSPR